MTTGKWLPWTTALLAHAAVVCAVVLWPRSPQAVTPPDFIAEDGLIPPSLTMDLTEFEPKVCPVHHIQMTPAEVPIAYGLLTRIANPEQFAATHPDEPPEAIRAQLFPHNDSFIWGGCCVSNEQSARIYVCPECRRAEKQWRLTKQQSK